MLDWASVKLSSPTSATGGTPPLRDSRFVGPQAFLAILFFLSGASSVADAALIESGRGLAPARSSNQNELFTHVWPKRSLLHRLQPSLA